MAVNAETISLGAGVFYPDAHYIVTSVDGQEMLEVTSSQKIPLTKKEERSRRRWGRALTALGVAGEVAGTVNVGLGLVELFGAAVAASNPVTAPAAIILFQQGILNLGIGSGALAMGIIDHVTGYSDRKIAKAIGVQLAARRSRAPIH